MEPRCCHLSRRFSDSNHSSCSMRQQIGKWLFVSNTSALIHWGILFPLTPKVKYAEFSSFFRLRLAKEIRSTQQLKGLCVNLCRRNSGRVWEGQMDHFLLPWHPNRYRSIFKHGVFLVFLSFSHTLSPSLEGEMIQWQWLPHWNTMISVNILMPSVLKASVYIHSMNTIRTTANTHYILFSVAPFLSHKLLLLGGMEVNFPKLGKIRYKWEDCLHYSVILHSFSTPALHGVSHFISTCQQTPVNFLGARSHFKNNSIFFFCFYFSKNEEGIISD